MMSKCIIESRDPRIGGGVDEIVLERCKDDSGGRLHSGSDGAAEKG